MIEGCSAGSTGIDWAGGTGGVGTTTASCCWRGGTLPGAGGAARGASPCGRFAMLGEVSDDSAGAGSEPLTGAAGCRRGAGAAPAGAGAAAAGAAAPATGTAPVPATATFGSSPGIGGAPCPSLTCWLLYLALARSAISPFCSFSSSAVLRARSGVAGTVERLG